MKTARFTLSCASAVIGACALVFAAGGHAQVRIAAKPQPAAPAARAAITQPVLPGAPSANGLSSPFPPSVPDLAVPGTSSVGTTPAGTPPTDTATAVETQGYAVVGAGAYGTRGMRQTTAMGAGPLTDVDIARSFLNADSNHDGDLSRAEATRLSIAPLAFEEMDANHDDILTRSEYEAAVR